MSLNRGNFLETVYLVSKYDSVLKEHLKKLEKRAGKLSVSYLSPKTQNELISILANHLKQKLITEIMSAKYYGIMFDSTPDISNIDQMSDVIS